MSRINFQLKTATELFHGGRLAEASVLCEALAADGEASSQFLGLFGQLQLLRNRTDAAEPLLVAALAEAPESPRLRALLAETYRRAGRLFAAAELYRNLGRPALAAKLAATGGDWYRLTPPSAPVTLP
jgi:predicted Zn-dependent protease